MALVEEERGLDLWSILLQEGFGAGQLRRDAAGVFGLLVVDEEGGALSLGEMGGTLGIANA